MTFPPLRHYDLFAGMGGASVGAGLLGRSITTVGFCELDRHARRYLNLRFPGRSIHPDIRTLGPEQLRGVGPIDIVSGGWPCQEHSRMGKRVGLKGARSGLAWELVRVVALVRPRYLLLENVPDSAESGLGDLLGALAALGYDLEWRLIDAASFGACHERERLYGIGRLSPVARAPVARAPVARAPVARAPVAPRPGGYKIITPCAKMRAMYKSGSRGGPCEILQAIKWLTQHAKGTWQSRDWASASFGVPDLLRAVKLELEGRGIEDPGLMLAIERVAQHRDLASLGWLSIPYRLAMMGFPYNWLDLETPNEALAPPALLSPKAAWDALPWSLTEQIPANYTALVRLTGNAMVPQCAAAAFARILELDRMDRMARPAGPKARKPTHQPQSLEA